mgnify:CR=1 FL=1
MSLNSIKLVTLSDSWGYEDPLDMIESIGLLASPGICMNLGCDYTIDVEPDSTKGWCDCCETQTIASALVLAGLI